MWNIHSGVTTKTIVTFTSLNVRIKKLIRLMRLLSRLRIYFRNEMTYFRKFKYILFKKIQLVDHILKQYHILVWLLFWQQIDSSAIWKVTLIWKMIELRIVLFLHTCYYWVYKVNWINLRRFSEFKPNPYDKKGFKHSIQRVKYFIYSLFTHKQSNYEVGPLTQDIIWWKRFYQFNRSYKTFVLPILFHHLSVLKVNIVNL